MNSCQDSLQVSQLFCHRANMSYSLFTAQNLSDTSIRSCLDACATAGGDRRERFAALGAGFVMIPLLRCFFSKITQLTRMSRKQIIPTNFNQ